MAVALFHLLDCVIIVLLLDGSTVRFVVGLLKKILWPGLIYLNWLLSLAKCRLLFDDRICVEYC